MSTSDEMLSAVGRRFALDESPRSVSTNIASFPNSKRKYKGILVFEGRLV